MKLIDLFAGAGGLSCGLEMAGFHPILANELNDGYASTYARNHPTTPMVVGDIRQLFEKDLQEVLNIQQGDLDLLAGGPDIRFASCLDLSWFRFTFLPSAAAF